MKRRPKVYVGMDVHKDTVTIAVLPEAAREPTLVMRMSHDPRGLRRMLGRLAREHEVRACYEASGAGYVLERKIRAWGHECEIVAPSLIPRRPGERRKHDRKDAEELARLYRAGELVTIRVPTEREERVRDLVRCRPIRERWQQVSKVLGGFRICMPIPCQFARGSTVLLFLLTTSCGDGGTEPAPPQNQAPTAVGSIAAVSLVVGGAAVTDVAGNFSDPDGDALAYEAVSSDTGVAVVAASGSEVTVTGVAVGQTTITVTAADPAGLSATQSYAATVMNRPPVATAVPEEQIQTVGDTVSGIDVSTWFTDPDGDSLAYAASSADTAVATAQVDGSLMNLVARSQGRTTVTVTATDPGDLSIALEIPLKVLAPNRPPEITDPVGTVRLVVGEELSGMYIPEFFTDPDGDSLTYAASSADTAVATAEIDGLFMTLFARSQGTTTITVTATDPGGLSAAQKITVNVVLAIPNQPPVLRKRILPVSVFAGDTAFVVAMDSVFIDPDGDPLAYAAVSSDTMIATSTVVGPAVWRWPDAPGLIVLGVAAGDIRVRVSATDPLGAVAEHVFEVTVNASAAPTVTSTIPTQDILTGGVAVLAVNSYFDNAHWTESFSYNTEVAHVNDIAVFAEETRLYISTWNYSELPPDTVATALLSVTAFNPFGSATQDSLLVRVHREEYATLPGLRAKENGTLSAVAANLTLTTCVKAASIRLAGLDAIVWSEWQRALEPTEIEPMPPSDAWITVQDNNRISTATGEGGSLCPLDLDDDSLPRGRYRLIGLFGVAGDPPKHYRTNSISRGGK